MNGDLPRHRYVWVDRRFTHARLRGFQRAVWFGLTSIPGRVWGCTVLLECGAVYRCLPPHALATRKNPVRPWGTIHAQRWDCYSDTFETREYAYLAGLRVGTAGGRGDYWFSIQPTGDGFTAEPEQNKEFHVVALDNGRLTIQPTNGVVFTDESFTGPSADWPKGLKATTRFWRCEYKEG